MGIYDDIDADVLRNYQEFALVNVIYLALRESSTSEQSARMTAMDSASKNACKTLAADFRYLISLFLCFTRFCLQWVSLKQCFEVLS